MSSSSDQSDSFGEGVVGDDGSLDPGALANRVVGTVYYGIILSVIGLIEFVSGAISAALGSLSSWVAGSGGLIATVYGTGDELGVSGAIRSAGEGMDIILDPIGPFAIVVSVAVALGLGIAIVRVTLAGVEILLGTNL